MRLLTLPLALAGMSLIASSASAGTVLRYYVDINSPSSGNGLSWGQSFQYLQDALDEAQTTLLGGCGCDIEIFVAAGTYRPDEDMFSPSGTNDRFASFVLLDEVTIYGHCAGFETNANQRDLQNPAYETILSGEIGGLNPTDNSYHVVDSSFSGDIPTTAVLDGFTIMDGYANGNGDNAKGGGLFADFGRCNVFNTTFRDNYAEYGGAVATSGGANQLFYNCYVLENSAGSGGGGSHLTGSFQTWIQSVFHRNFAPTGGGIESDDAQGNTVLTMKNVSMAVNISSLLDGADIRTVGGGTFNDLDITNCIFYSNPSWSLGDGTFVQADNNCILNGVGGIAMTGSVTLNTSNMFDGLPLFRDWSGGDLRIATNSPCAGAGDVSALQADLADLDGDGNRSEPVPFDLAGNARIVGALDVGAFEAACETNRYCVNGTNSYSVAFIEAHGECSVSAQDFTLQAWGVPDGPGIFFFGTNQTQVPFGNGFLCVTGNIKRLPPVFSSNHVLTYTMDWNHPNAAFLTAGSTWNFQAWYRDVPAGGAQFDTSNAVQVSFQN